MSTKETAKKKAESEQTLTSDNTGIIGKRTSLYVSRRLAQNLGRVDEGGVGERIADIIDRYQFIVKLHRKRVFQHFTDDELAAVSRASENYEWYPASAIAQGLGVALAENPSAADGLDVDTVELVRRLAELTYEESVAVLEICREQLWSEQARVAGRRRERRGKPAEPGAGGAKSGGELKSGERDE